MNIGRLFTREKIIDQAMGLAFGVLVAVGTSIVLQVAGADDVELLSKPFWIAVAVTAIRSGFTAIGTVLGLSIRGVSSA